MWLAGSLAASLLQAPTATLGASSGLVLVSWRLEKRAYAAGETPPPSKSETLAARMCIV
jgi:hypothetical protein